MSWGYAYLFFLASAWPQRASAFFSFAPKTPPANLVAYDKVLTLFGGDGAVNPSQVADFCSSNVQWCDLCLSKVLTGREAVKSHVKLKFPEGSKLVLERAAEGNLKSGFTWHYEVPGIQGVGLRGTTYVEVDDDGLISYVKECSEPIMKPGKLTAELLKAATKNVERVVKVPTYAPKDPKSAPDLVEYLWKDAYPGGASPDEAIRLFSESIRYEDFNYEDPFLGKDEVSCFLKEFDFPGIEFIPDRISEGDRGCAFTWRVSINGQDGPEGISFYEMDEDGKVCFIRDIPAPSIKPPPLQALAATLRPRLRVFSPRP